MQPGLSRLRDGIEDTLLDEALSAGGLRTSNVQLAPVLADAHSMAEALGAGEKNVNVVLQEPICRLTIRADPRVVRPAVRGLLRAALHIARPGATIRVGANPQREKARVAVAVEGFRRLPGNRLPDLPDWRAPACEFGLAFPRVQRHQSWHRPCPARTSCAACKRSGREGVPLDAKSRIIAIFNTNPEVLELVRESLQQAGFQAVIAHIDDLKRGRLDMIQFVEEHKPDVIVYDVAPPYDTNWTFLRLMRNSKVMQGRAFVVTTTNKRALEELIGPTDVVELLCKPYDLQQIVDACTAAFEKQVKAKTA